MPSYDVFVSNAAADLEWTNGVLGYALKQAGVRWISESQFAVGTDRAAAIAEAIAASRFLVIVLSPAYVADNWKQFELNLIDTASVEKRSTRVIPLLKEQVEIPPTLKRFTSIDFTRADKTPAALTNLFAALNGTHAPRQKEKPPCPYPGLYAFDETKSEYFFGRQREIDKLVNLLRRHNFVAVTGASGSGKSSLVRAGLPPALRESSQFGEGEWNVLLMRPGEQPLTRLRALFPKQAADVTSPAPNAKENSAGAQNILLIVDALEELLTLVRTEPERREFERALLELLRLPYVYIAVTVRSDFFMGFGNSLLRDEMIAHELRLEPLDAEGLREAIREPAHKVKVEIEATLVERLVNDSERDEGASILPLIQETLVRLWDTGLVGRYLPLSAYEKIPNGLHGVLSEHAEQTYAELVTDEKKEYARRIFLQLIQVNAQPPDTRRSLALEKLRARFKNEKSFQETLEHLVHNRLLISDATSEVMNSHVDLAHERLIDKWERLKKWIEADRDGLRLAQTLTQDATEWERHKRASSFLYRGEQLREVKGWADAHEGELNETERAFYKQSNESEARLRVLKIGVGIIVLLLLGVMLSLMWAEKWIFAPKLDMSQETFFGADEIYTLWQDSDGALYVGLGGNASRPSGVYRSPAPSADGWAALNFPGGGVTAILRDPRNPQVFYLGLERSPMRVSRDGGMHWEEIKSDKPMTNVVSLNNGPDDAIYATDLVSGLYVSRDLGETWKAEQGPPFQLPTANWIFARWLNERLVVSTYEGELYIKSFAGNWDNLLLRDKVEDAVTINDELWAGGVGLFCFDKKLNRCGMEMEQLPLGAIAVSNTEPRKLATISTNGYFSLIDPVAKQIELSISRDAQSKWTVPLELLADPHQENLFWLGTDAGLYRIRILSWKQTPVAWLLGKGG